MKSEELIGTSIPVKEAEVILAVPFSPQTLLVASLSAAVLLVVLIALVSRRKSAARGKTVLFVGPPDGGKTAVLSTLVYGQSLPTQMSLQPNTSILPLASGKTLKLVDIPGHPRIRDQFREHIPETIAIVFVVDASTIARNGPTVAEHLHHILNAVTSIPPSQTPPYLAIAAHKSDLLKAGASVSSMTLSVSRVKTILERELEKRRASQSGGVGVEGLGEEGENPDMGGLEMAGPPGESFAFEKWEGGEVEFLGTFIDVGSQLDEEKGGQNGLLPLQQWLEGL